MWLGEMVDSIQLFVFVKDVIQGITVHVRADFKVVQKQSMTMKCSALSLLKW